MVDACRSRDRLFAEYRRAVKEWVAAINNLRKITHDPHLMDRIENSRFRAITARAAYENHIVDHGCEDLVTRSTGSVIDDLGARHAG
jgi:hypothetical protein